MTHPAPTHEQRQAKKELRFAKLYGMSHQLVGDRLMTRRFGHHNSNAAVK